MTSANRSGDSFGLMAARSARHERPQVPPPNPHPLPSSLFRGGGEMEEQERNLTNEESRVPQSQRRGPLRKTARNEILAPEARDGEWASSLDRTSLVCGVSSASANGRMVKLHGLNALRTPIDSLHGKISWGIGFYSHPGVRLCTPIEFRAPEPIDGPNHEIDCQAKDN